MEEVTPIPRSNGQQPSKFDVDSLFENQNHFVLEECIKEDNWFEQQRPQYSHSASFREVKQRSQQQDQKQEEYNQLLKYRISELEKRIHNLELERNNQSTHFSSQLFSHEDNILQVKIIEYSPEWDFIEGGSKMVVCYQPMVEINQGYVVFGDKPSQAACIQPGVLKCYIPQNEEGCVKLSLLQHGKRIDDINDRPCIFEYKKNKSKKQQKRSKNIITDDKTYQSEFKVRVIEKLGGLQSLLDQFKGESINPQMYSEQILSGDEQKNQSSFTKLFVTLLSIASNKVEKEKITNFLDEPDQHGFPLIHYLTALGYQQTIKVLLKYNININCIGADNLTPLQIAVLLNNENMVSFLIQQGAIDAQFQDPVNRVDKLFKMENLYKNKNILDLLIRGVTLCDSIHNSSSVTDQRSWNDQDEQEDLNYFQLNEICNSIFIDHLEQEKLKETQQQNQHSHVDLREQKIRELLLTTNRQKQQHHKYFRNYSKPKGGILSDQKLSPNIVNNKLITKPYDEYQDHVKIIQKNVRAWLLRRQYLDMKYATTVLQNYIRNKIAKKDMNPDCKETIKNTLRNWLNLKDI